MDFEDWEPVYRSILADFGYGRDADRAARDRLAELLAGEKLFDTESFNWKDRSVAIAGDGPSLATDIETVRDAPVVVGTAGASASLRARDIGVDCVVTDLDTRPALVCDMTHEGVPVVVHGHGDNLEALERYVPRMKPTAVVPTTQAAPSQRVENFGGFTDGDRAAFFADAMGAGRLVFPGWDFDDPAVGEEKRRKLRWAARLLGWLEQRRGESFRLLDGRRGEIEAALAE
jgi:uncharacterized Rossmann fold enzyme